MAGPATDTLINEVINMATTTLAKLIFRFDRLRVGISRPW